MVFEADSPRCDIASIMGYLQCEDCGASSDNISSDLFINGESIASMSYNEDQDELRAIESNRISAGLK